MWNWSENQINLVLLRHGATASNKEHRYLGKTDEGLSIEGEKVLREAASKYPEADYIFSSPMKRCLETARILYPNQDIITIDEWEEMDFGDFEGKNYKELQGNELYQKWIDSNGILPFPNGESREEFIERCRRGFDNLLEKNLELPRKDKALTLGLIVHGGIIMALLSIFYGGDYFDYQVANGQGYICTGKEENGNFKITEIQKWGKDRV